jgi:prophage DNA circulation protein
MSDAENSLTPSPESKSSDTPKAYPTERHPSYLQFTEDGAKAALIEARGDIFIASQLLGVTAIRLNRAIQISPVLQASLEVLKESSQGVSAAAIHKAIEDRMSLYRVAGLDALHDLATMPIDSNSAQNQVKLAAAARLAGPQEGLSGSGDLAETLRALNEQYQKEAPRLRVVRERVTVETIPEKTVLDNPE